MFAVLGIYTETKKVQEIKLLRLWPKIRFASSTKKYDYAF